MQRHSFNDLHAESRARGERNDCTVKALAVVMGAPYDAAHRTLEQHGRIRGRGCNRTVWLPALHALGGEYLDVTQAVRGAGGRTVLSIEQVLQRGAFARRRFLILTRGHILAFDGERIVDWTQGRRHRVLAVLEVTGTYNGHNNVPQPTQPDLPLPEPAPMPEPSAPTPEQPERPTVAPRRRNTRDYADVDALRRLLDTWHDRA